MERLNKYLAHAGVGSRRHCDEMILNGRISVDGRVVRELGVRVDPELQKLAVDGQPLQSERLVYWALNKPRGYLCTNDDPGGRPLAVQLLEHVTERVYTVGRLDEDSEGLLLMTNDGALSFQLTHPRFGVYKTYQVLVAGRPSTADMEQLLAGVWLSDGHVRARKVKRMKSQGESTWLQIVLSEGKNREVRRMLARLGHKVMRLRRIAIGSIKLDRLPAGKSRRLRREEIEELRDLAVRATERAARPDARPAAGEDRPPLTPRVRPTEERPRPARSQAERPRPARSQGERPRPARTRPARSRP